jgi:hypothetical protein
MARWHAWQQRRGELAQGGRVPTRAELRKLAGWQEQIAREEYVHIASIQFDQWVERHLVDEKQMTRELAVLPPIADAEVDDFIRRFPEYGRDPQGRERARDNVRRLREIDARKRMLERQRAAHPPRFLLRSPSAARETAQPLAPRTVGDAKSRAQLLAFHGFGCNDCALGSKLLIAVMSRFAGRVRLIAGDYFNPPTLAGVRSALTLRCAGEQRDWWPMMLALDGYAGSVGIDELVARARTAGYDGPRFAACLESDRFLTDVFEDLVLADRLGLERGIPGLFASGVRIGRLLDVDGVIKQIEAALAAPL